jgi:hypothetical protein
MRSKATLSPICIGSKRLVSSVAAMWENLKVWMGYRAYNTTHFQQKHDEPFLTPPFGHGIPAGKVLHPFDMMICSS